MPDEENDTNDDEQSNAFAESVFLGEIAERACDLGKDVRIEVRH